MRTESPSVVQIGLHVDRQRREAAALLDAWPTLVEVAEAAQHAGVRVAVAQAGSRDEILTRNGVAYHFFAHRSGPEAVIRSLEPDILHVHGLGFPHAVLELAAGFPGVPILLQDHASRLPRVWRRRLYRRAFASAAAVAFCARPQGLPFERAGLIRGPTSIHAIAESTTRFTPGAQAHARARTGLAGDPCLLWVGHLNDNKDPLTVLEGVSRTVPVRPGLELWCCFRKAPLEAAVRRRIEGDPRLRGRVHLLGPRPHEQVEQLLRAADLYVAGSHHEGSGYALIEALGCGLAPLVTDIPSFRALTGNGTVGRLWRCGDPQSLAESLLSISAEAGPALRATVRAHFERELSLAALGRRLRETYRCLLGRREARK